MSKRAHWIVLSVAAALLLLPGVALAHVAIASGPVHAGARAVVTFSVGHGCEGADTLGIDVQLPEAITSVRGVPNVFGPADVKVNDAEVPTNVVWTKDSVRDGDDQFYELQIRITVPDTPFQVLYFPVTQTCRDKDGNESTVEWAALPGDEPPADGEEAPPAAALVILPPMAPGWNEVTVDVEISDLAMYFGDAQIVWSGEAAYSANPTTAAMIEDEDDVTTLESIEAGSKIWVKY